MVIDRDGNPVEHPDLSRGHVVRSVRIRPGAAPLGNGKVAWADEDWEDVDVYVPYTTEQLAQIARARLNATDYVAAKAVDALMGCTDAASVLDVLAAFRAEYAKVIAERAELRRTVNELAGEVD